MQRNRFFSLVALSLLASETVLAQERWLHSFEQQRLSDVFYCEGATAGDVSGDGVNDIISGSFWYEGPSFEKRHEFAPVKNWDPKGYSNNFFAYVYDFDRDGKNDILIIGFPGAETSWFKNPGKTEGHWPRHIIFDSTDNESPSFTDLTGDGKPELVCQTAGRFGYASPDWEHPERKWKFTAISVDRKLGKFTHGMGVGDVNGDGKLDLLEKTGWYEQPDKLDGEPLWQHHAYPFSGPGGAQMFAYDVDGDGDNDVITGLAAHGFGLAWYEQIKTDDGALGFRPHVIMEGPLPVEKQWDKPGNEDLLQPKYDVRFSNLHAIELVDMDGDGLRDIVTGKRYWAHFNEAESGGLAVNYWFKLVRGDDGVEFVPYMIDDDSGVGTQIVVKDVNGDKLPDLVVGNKRGTYYLEHKKRRVDEQEWKAAQPKKRSIFYTGALAPERAARVMEVPEGFEVDLIAAEPRIHQPVAFAIDDRGRLWVAEAHTYPQRVGGPSGAWNAGKDSIVILEDKDGDGSFESRSVFAENLNLVSGIEIGFGGVWVGAAPYLLFLPDADSDDRFDGEPKILLDGFGLEDTHETLNSFIWGPDGWLYGCHGIFTHSLVGKPGTPSAQRTPLNAGYWRYHPTRHEFEVFAWGTSNPWGLDFNELGQAFSTACVIPHLYHVVQGARYQRQAGQDFNAFIYDDIKTIGDHLHYEGKLTDHAWWGHEPRTPTNTLDAGGGHAHCGAVIYLGDSFPAEYRGKLFMNNIHGNRVNTDVLERRGSGYVGRHGSDLMVSNNLWYRGIDLQYGPSGDVFIIDWYDRNACHRTQPLIWDRSNGRIFRVRYGNKAAKQVDLASLSDAQLVELFEHKNDWYVRTARRVLQQRGLRDETLLARLRSSAKEHADPTRRLRALWLLHAVGKLDESTSLALLSNSNEHVRAWTVQLVCENRAATKSQRARFLAMAQNETSAVVRLYLASAMQRMKPQERFGIAAKLLAHGEDSGDHNIPLLIWYGIEPLVAESPVRALELLDACRIEMVSRFLIRRAAAQVADLQPVMITLAKAADDQERKLILTEMLTAFRDHADLEAPAAWTAVYDSLIASTDPQIVEQANEIAVRFGDRRVFPQLRRILADSKNDPAKRANALRILRDGRDTETAPVLHKLLDEAAFRGAALRALALFEHADTSSAILKRIATMNVEDKRDALLTLASRPSYAKALLAAVKTKAFPRKEMTAFVVRQLRLLNSAAIDEELAASWGVVGTTSAEKLAEIQSLKKALSPEVLAKADLPNGRAGFDKICAQCHSLFGVGGSIAPDLTGSNRSDMDYILENILDPNAVVGKDYQADVFVMNDGRVISGFVVRESTSAVTVRTTSEEVLLRKKGLVKRSRSESSLMPEGLLNELSATEKRDLIAYLASSTPVLARGAPATIDAKTHRASGVIEAEALRISRKTGGIAGPQNMSAYGAGKWSGNSQIWWRSAKPGDELEIVFTTEKAGKFAVDVALTKARDYGIVKLSLDGNNAGSVDLFDPHVIPSGPLSLGRFDLSKGEHRLLVHIVGANAKAAKGFMFGIDFIHLREASE